MSVIGYGRCSTTEQASNGVSIEVQRRAVERVAEANGWEMTWLADEGVSGAVPPESRKRFKAALALLDAGESEALIFTKVDRASRCTEDFARLLRISEEQGWRLIVTELGIDTRAPMGKAMAHMAVVFAELEGDLIRSRTREAQAVRREHGVVLGRPRSTPDDVVARVYASDWRAGPPMPSPAT
jgi:DNA invertase Pin-like site-specific DNA recombinase